MCEDTRQLNVYVWVCRFPFADGGMEKRVGWESNFKDRRSRNRIGEGERERKDGLRSPLQERA